MDDAIMVAVIIVGLVRTSAHAAFCRRCGSLEPFPSVKTRQVLEVYGSAGRAFLFSLVEQSLVPHSASQISYLGSNVMSWIKL